MDKRAIIEKKLQRYRELPDKIEHFNKAFMALIKAYDGRNELIGSLLDDQGNLHLTNFSSAIDKLDMLYDIYDNNEKRFFRLPSKEMLLLTAVGLDMYDDLDMLLEAAGYNRNMKNLHEFIIYSGLCNYKSLDEIRDKLIRYGFRGNKAIDSEHLFDYVGEQAPEKLRDYFENLAKSKKKKVKQVLVEAGLISPKWDVTRNRYYSESLSGGRVGPVVLTKEQCIRLFEALELSKDEQIDFMDVLLEGHYIIEEDVKSLQQMVIEGNCNILIEPIKSTIAIGVNDKSVYTTLFNNTVERLSWEELEGFIAKNFGQVRSFAVYLDSVFAFENEKVIAFAERTGLKKTALYEYKNGMCLPDFEYLTIMSSLLTKMNTTIYKTLLKKAGKLEFGEYGESPLLVIMEVLLGEKENDALVFGELMDFLEFLMVEESELMNNCYELYATYELGHRIVLERLASLNDNQDGRPFESLIKHLPKNKQVHIQGLSQLIRQNALSIGAEFCEYTINQLKCNYGFKTEALLVHAIQSLVIAEVSHESS